MCQYLAAICHGDRIYSGPQLMTELASTPGGEYVLTNTNASSRQKKRNHKKPAISTIGSTSYVEFD